MRSRDVKGKEDMEERTGRRSGSSVGGWSGEDTSVRRAGEGRREK